MRGLKNDKGDNLFARVKKNIKQVRKQGDPPEEDLENMDGYVCDLCKSGVERSDVTQCPFCGRWVCRTKCYSSDELCCISCAGVIRLMRESVVLRDLSTDDDDEQTPVEKVSKNKKKKKK